MGTVIPSLRHGNLPQRKNPCFLNYISKSCQMSKKRWTQTLEYVTDHYTAHVGFARRIAFTRVCIVAISLGPAGWFMEPFFTAIAIRLMESCLCCLLATVEAPYPLEHSVNVQVLFLHILQKTDDKYPSTGNTWSNSAHTWPRPFGGGMLY